MSRKVTGFSTFKVHKELQAGEKRMKLTGDVVGVILVYKDQETAMKREPDHKTIKQITFVEH